MNTIVKKLALVALCTTALTAAVQTSYAAPAFTISGVSQNGFTYGTDVRDDNVINFTGQPAANNTGSTVNDPNSAPSTWIGSGPTRHQFVRVGDRFSPNPRVHCLLDLRWFRIG